MDSSFDTRAHTHTRTHARTTHILHCAHAVHCPCTQRTFSVNSISRLHAKTLQYSASLECYYYCCNCCCCAGEGELRPCALTSDSCRISYKIDSLKFGTEDALVIFIDNTTGVYRDLRDGKCIFSLCKSG